jgi:flagellar FliJ protein
MNKGAGMSRRFPLESVMELARKQVDAAAGTLAGLRAKESAALQTLQMLETCRQDYRSRFERSSQSGIGNEQWRNYHEFSGKLDQALAQQKEVMAKSTLRCEASVHEWQRARIKLKSFEVLFERHVRDERSAASHQLRKTPI